MNRRDFIRIGMAGSAVAAASGETMAATVASGAKKKGGFSIVEASVADLQAAMQSGKQTSVSLVKAYLARIKAIDKAGPRINSVLELNPDALKIAAALDKERKTKGPRGPLHGVPVLIKDNIATADKMQTTAGSLALLGVKPPRDAFLVTKLREAGAVILGKTNLSEWANLRSTRSTSGWSGRGGQTRNPYALDRDPSGSSSGSGASIAASLAAIAVGTETDGSIISPSKANGLVGIKPTMGLVSRNGVIPLSHSQDTAGPMARSVADAAALLTALAGSDARDPATKDADAKKQDYMKFLDADGLKGMRIGVIRANFGGRNDLVAPLIDEAIKLMASKGAVIVDPVVFPNQDKYGATELEVLLYELKADMAAYLGEFAAGSNFKTLKDLIDFNELNKAKEMPYFSQEHFLKADTKGGLDSKEYLDALANNLKFSREEGIDKVLKENNLDCLLAPSGQPTGLIDLINGSNGGGGGFTSPAAVAGYPHITVPAGYVFGLPIGVSLVSTAWNEGTLIKIAYAYEQASKKRQAPTFAKTLTPLHL